MTELDWKKQNKPKRRKNVLDGLSDKLKIMYEEDFTVEQIQDYLSSVKSIKVDKSTIYRVLEPQKKSSFKKTQAKPEENSEKETKSMEEILDSIAK